MKKSTFFILIVLVAGLAISCKKSCNLSPKEGYTIVGDDKDCYYESDGSIFEINSVEELNGKLSQIEQSVLGGNTIEVKITGALIANKSQYRVLKAFGSLRKNYGENIKLNMNGYTVNPEKAGQTLTHAEWTSWSKLNLGVNNAEGAPTGSKSGIQWVVPSNELGLFEKDGQGGGILLGGAPETERSIELQNDTELQNAPNEVIAYQGIYEELYVKFTENFDFSNLGARSLDKLVTMEKQNMHVFANGSSKIGPATDSIHFYNAATIYRLNEIDALEQMTLGGGKYIYLGTTNQSSRDSLLAINNLVYRFPEANSDNLNLNREIPNTIHLVRNKEDVRTMFTNQFINQYKGRVELRPASRPELPWKEQNVCGVNAAFLDRYECRNPFIPAKEGITGPTVWTQTPLVLNEYYEVKDGVGCWIEPDGLNVPILYFGLDNESGKKVEASYNKAKEITGFPLPKVTKVASGRSIPVKLQTNEEKFKDGGKVIVNVNFLIKQGYANNVSGPGLDWAQDMLLVENLKIYISPSLKEEYDYYERLGGPGTFLLLARITASNCDVIFSLPSGKQCYDWQ